MRRHSFAALLGAGVLCGVGAASDITLGVAQHDVWAYISAVQPASNIVLSAWGLPPNDLNPGGFPGSQPSANFYSHAFVGWQTGTIPSSYRWGGARITLTLASDTWVPESGDVYVRFLSGPLTEGSWNIFLNTPVPVSALGRVAGNDANATNTDDVITIDLPGTLSPQVWRAWLNEGQVFVAITADNSPPPPGMPGEPPNLTGALQIWSGEDIFGRGPAITLKMGRQGDANGDGVIDFLDLNFILSDFGRSGSTLRGDLNRDNVVDFLDLNEVLSFFGT